MTEPLPLPAPVALERALLTTLPASRVAFLGSAVVRAAAGASSRLNCATWLDPDDRQDLPSRVARIEAWYDRLGFPARFRLTPLSPPGLDHALMMRGYAREEERVMLAAPLDTLPLPDGPAEIAEEPDEAWFAANEEAAERSAASMAELRAAPALLLVPDAWISVRSGRRVASTGFVATDGVHAGLAWLATIPSCRGQGLARRVVLAGFGWARAEGAAWGFVQVETGNDASLALFRRLGFREAYRYGLRTRA